MNKNLFTIIDFEWAFYFMKVHFEEVYNEKENSQGCKIITFEMRYWLSKGPYHIF